MRKWPSTELQRKRSLLISSAFLLWTGLCTAQMVDRPSTVWGEVPLEPEGFRFGGVEILSTLLMSQVVLGIFSAMILVRAWRLLHRARVAQGSEIEILWGRAQREQKFASWLAFGFLPMVGVVTLLLAPARTLFGITLPSLAFCLFLLPALVGGVTFLVLEAVRRSLGAERI